MARPLHLPDYFQKVDFKALYKIHGQKKKGLRLLALSYLQEGRSVKETASLLFKTEYTVREWVHLYDAGEIDGLLSIRPGRGRNTIYFHSLLSPSLVSHNELCIWDDCHQIIFFNKKLNFLSYTMLLLLESTLLSFTLMLFLSL